MRRVRQGLHPQRAPQETLADPLRRETARLRHVRQSFPEARTLIQTHALAQQGVVDAAAVLALDPGPVPLRLADLWERQRRRGHPARLAARLRALRLQQRDSRRRLGRHLHSSAGDCAQRARHPHHSHVPRPSRHPRGSPPARDSLSAHVRSVGRGCVKEKASWEQKLV